MRTDESHEINTSSEAQLHVITPKCDKKSISLARSVREMTKVPQQLNSKGEKKNSPDTIKLQYIISSATIKMNGPKNARLEQEHHQHALTKKIRPNVPQKIIMHHEPDIREYYKIIGKENLDIDKCTSRYSAS